MVVGFSLLSLSSSCAFLIARYSHVGAKQIGIFAGFFHLKEQP
jgi:hypothetical protein